MPKRMKIDYIEVGQLRTDKRFITQRSLRPTWAKQLADEWDDELCAPIYVAHNGTGSTYYNIDGQHRAAAIETKYGPHGLIPAIVYENVDERRRAELYLKHNAVAVQRPLDVFPVAVTAQRPVEVGVMATLRRHKLRMWNDRKDKGNTGIEGVISCAKTLTKLQDKDPAALSTALGVLIAAYGRNPDALRGEMVHGCALIFMTYKGVDPNRLARKLATAKNPLNIRRDALTLQGGLGKSLAINVMKIMAARYDSGLKHGRIDAA